MRELEMGGGGGGGYIPPIDLKKLTEKANQRIQGALSDRQSIVFVCAPSDENELHRIVRASQISGREYIVATQEKELREEIKKSGLVVYFVDRSEDHSVIELGIVIASELKKQNFFVHNRERYSLPNYVLQFRVRIMPWVQFVEIVVG
jgi:hypothetical protein